MTTIDHKQQIDKLRGYKQGGFYGEVAFMTFLEKSLMWLDGRVPRGCLFKSVIWKNDFKKLLF